MCCLDKCDSLWDIVAHGVQAGNTLWEPGDGDCTVEDVAGGGWDVGPTRPNGVDTAVLVVEAQLGGRAHFLNS